MENDENQMARSICSAPEFSEVFCFLLGKGNTLFWGLVLNILDVAPSVIKTANWNEFQLQRSEEQNGAGKQRHSSVSALQKQKLKT